MWWLGNQTRRWAGNVRGVTAAELQLEAIEEREVQMRRAVLIGVVLAGVAWSGARAQAPASVQPGQRVRVRSTIAYVREVTGVVQTIGPDTLLVRDDDRSVATAIPLATVDRLQVSHGRRSHWMTGAALGFGVGAATGAAIGAASGSDWLFTSSENAFLGAILFAPIGAATGVLVGLMVKTERWETISLDGVAPTVSRGPDGRFSVGLRLAL
jgi:hypothetical protein